MKSIHWYTLAVIASLGVSPAFAQKKPRTGTTAPGPVLQNWMSSEVADAWKQGFTGKGTFITAVDDFTSGSRLSGNLTGASERLRHGEWTLKQSGLVAYGAALRAQDYNSGQQVALGAGLNILNLSYGMMAAPGLNIGWSAQETSIIAYASNGTAVISKAAGNDYGTAVGQVNGNGQLDYLNRDLIGKQSTIFVGALNSNGTALNPASMAMYSNVAGANTTVQNQFLVVGVEGTKTMLYGTSFAAPIISGYAAILGSKFTAATPTQIVNQLLNTARTDTISGYSSAVHGKGEASLTRALAPVAIQ